MRKFLGLLLFGFSSFASAYTSDRALANLTEDYGDCIAYFTVVVVDAQEQAKKQPDQKWSSIEAHYMKASADAIGQLKTIMIDIEKLPEQHVVAKLDLHMQMVQKTLAAEGMDRLMVQYMDMCKALVENPIPRLQYWMDKQ